MEAEQNGAVRGGETAAKKPIVCPIDPAELAQCDSCQ